MLEAIGRDIQDALQAFPATPKRKKDIAGLSFQAITKSNDNLGKWFGIEFLAALSPEDRIRVIHRPFRPDTVFRGANLTVYLTVGALEGLFPEPRLGHSEMAPEVGLEPTLQYYNQNDLQRQAHKVYLATPN